MSGREQLKQKLVEKYKNYFTGISSRRFSGEAGQVLDPDNHFDSVAERTLEVLDEFIKEQDNTFRDSTLRVGDRVIVTNGGRSGEVPSNPYLESGDTGTIVGFEDEDISQVEWDKYLREYGHDCLGNAKDDYGWRVREWEIKKL